MSEHNPIPIRIAIPYDAEVLATLAAETFWNTYQGSIDHGDIWSFIRVNFTPEKIRQDINSNSGIYVIAEDQEKQPMGYAKLSTDYLPPKLKGKRALEINKIYVATAAKGKGIGQALMQFISGYAKEHTFDSIWLAVWENNKPAIGFYTKMGYKKIADVPFIMGSETHNDYVVVKEL